MHKKLLSVILAVMMIVSMIPISAIPAAAEESVTYVDRYWDETQKKVVEKTETVTATPITSTSTALDSGWYFVDGNVTINEKITVNGTFDNPTRIILKDGGRLTASKGIHVAGMSTSRGSDPNRSLVIYGQAAGTGTLVATGSDGAGIGASGDYFPWDTDENNSGFITINGGIVNATTDSKGFAGIGGGSRCSFCGSVTINGGTVTASGGELGAGIGGGYGYFGSSYKPKYFNDTYYPIGGTVIINGGTVTGTGSTAAGIGGGYFSIDSIITINGGTVTGICLYDGAGIGTGQDSEGSCSVTINGGTVIGNCLMAGSGIGVGYYSSASGLVVIDGGTVTATGNNSAGIDCDITASCASVKAGGAESGTDTTLNEYLTARSAYVQIVVEHNFAYTDNGDGTHTCKCTRCGSSLTPESHTFVDRVCTFCGAKLHVHSLTKISVKDAACTVDGISTAYWVCEGEEGCGKYFSDENGENEISAETVAGYVIGKLGHDFTGAYVNYEGDLWAKKCSRCDTYDTENALTGVTVPTKKTGLIYNGQEQTGVAEGEGYTLSGDFKATDAGIYHTAATLEMNCIWSDGTLEPKEFVWSIDKVVITVPKAQLLEYTGEEQIGVAENEGYTLNGISKTADVGAYLVMVTLKENYIWSDNTSETKNIAWAIYPAAPAAHEHTFESEYSYNETDHWQAATCEHTTLANNIGEHTFDENGKCTVCGYEKGTDALTEAKTAMKAEIDTAVSGASDEIKAYAETAKGEIDECVSLTALVETYTAVLDEISEMKTAEAIAAATEELEELDVISSSAKMIVGSVKPLLAMASSPAEVDVILTQALDGINDAEEKVTDTDRHIVKKLPVETDNKMGHQFKTENGRIINDVGRAIICLTEEQLNKITSDKVVIVGGDFEKETTFTFDCAYTYFYSGETKYTAEELGCVAFLIIDHDASGEAISGFGYYRVYDGSSDSEDNFILDALYVNPND